MSLSSGRLRLLISSNRLRYVRSGTAPEIQHLETFPPSLSLRLNTIHFQSFPCLRSITMSIGPRKECRFLGVVESSSAVDGILVDTCLDFRSLRRISRLVGCRLLFSFASLDCCRLGLPSAAVCFPGLTLGSLAWNTHRQLGLPILVGCAPIDLLAGAQERTYTQPVSGFGCLSRPDHVR